jgi:HK97 family phage major capsid protein
MDNIEIQAVIKTMNGIESSMASFQEQAKKDIEANGKMSLETSNALDALGVQQKEIADRLLQMEQKGGASGESTGIKSMGAQFIESGAYNAFKEGSTQKARIEISNSTTTGSDVTVAPDRKAAIVPGAAKELTLEDLLISIPTTSNAIEYTREASFVNNAAEVAEGAAKPETTITFALETMPVATIAHWTKISRQLADDAPALAAYINFRMTYGVNERADAQIGSGDGVGSNISGLLNAANYTAHGIANANLGTVLKKHVLIRKVVALLRNTGYRADAVLLNPVDYADMEIEAGTTANVSGVSLGVPVVESTAVSQDEFLVGAFQQAATIHNRQGVVVELSESDSDNFTKNLVTVRAERRLALTVEVPAALMGGDLTPV